MIINLNKYITKRKKNLKQKKLQNELPYFLKIGEGDVKRWDEDNDDEYIIKFDFGINEISEPIIRYEDIIIRLTWEDIVNIAIERDLL